MIAPEAEKEVLVLSSWNLPVNKLALTFLTIFVVMVMWHSCRNISLQVRLSSQRFLFLWESGGCEFGVEWTQWGNGLWWGKICFNHYFHAIDSKWIFKIPLSVQLIGRWFTFDNLGTPTNAKMHSSAQNKMNYILILWCLLSFLIKAVHHSTRLLRLQNPGVSFSCT